MKDCTLRRTFASVLALVFLTTPNTALAIETSAHGATAEHLMFTMLLFVVLLLLAKFGNLIERIGQPAVLGELLVGVILGNLSLFGIYIFDTAANNEILLFLAEMGLILLLFQVGLESNIAKLRAVGARAMLVAIIGVVVPFGLGVFIIGPLVFPTLPFIAHLFLGAALTATSVGITARVFQDLGIGGSRESQIVVNAAVIDDVLGLIILAVVVGLAETGSISIVGIGIISFKAITFLFLSIFLGLKLAGPISRLFSAISSGVGMKLTIALAFAVGFAYLATKVGLANIVGAYAAGLVLDHVHFTRFRRPRIAEDLESLSCCLQDDESKKKVNNLLNESCDRHVEDLITDVSYILTPLFFVFTGMAVKFSALSDPKVWGIGAVVIIVAIIGKIVSGLGAGPGVNKWLVGVGMVPRGEVGLIFATLGLSLGIVSPELFAIIVLMVIVTTLCTPPVLGLLSKRSVKVQP